jgi:hypothetical protein
MNMQHLSIVIAFYESPNEGALELPLAQREERNPAVSTKWPHSSDVNVVFAAFFGPSRSR